MAQKKSYDTEGYRKRVPKVISEEKALEKAMYYCSRAEHCTHEVREKLSVWGLENLESIDKIIERLKTEKFIDDARFASSYIREKMIYNRWGKIKIAMHLRLKKIKESTYLALLEDFDDETYITNLEYILGQKWRSIKGKDDYERKQKLIRFAFGRGYELDIVLEHVEKMTN
ncbi:MAG: regulatory protein RecX [Bacteroidaceae bacterium]